MYQNYKVVANTAVGRRRYLKLLLPQVLASDIVDRYDLWVNTMDKVDIAFFQAMAEEFPKLNLIWQPKGEINGIFSMADFYPFCQDEDTIYIKLDDDVVWFDPNFFEEICRFRIENPEYFLVSPLVINNGISTYILQNQGFLKFNQYFNCQGYDLKFYNGYLAENLQRWFIENYITANKYSQLYCGTHRIAMQRFAINAVAWFGKSFKKFEGRVIGDDEEFLTITYPAKHDLINCFDCNTIVSHFSFSVQREYLDKTDLLKVYENILRKSSNYKLVEILNKTSSILNSIELNSNQIQLYPLPHNYRRVVNPTTKYERIKRILEYFFGILKIPKAHRRQFVIQYLCLIRPNREYFKPLQKMHE